MNIILSVGFVFLAGLIAARFVNKLRFPSVTAYLLLGIVLGPGIFGLLSKDILGWSGLISNIVLGLIAFGIGQNFSIDSFRRIGKSVLWISLSAAILPWLIITLVLWLLLQQPFYLSLIFGAIASATAPAATVMVVREYRARGTFTDTLLGVVAIDDAWCLIIFALSLALAKAVSLHTANNILIIQILFKSVVEILGSFVLGVIVAFCASFFSKHIRTPTELLIYTLGFLLLNIGLALSLHISILLSCMALGACVVNINKANFKFFDTLRNIDSPLYLIFFVLAGASLEINLLAKIGLLGVGYVVFRVVGKIFGAYLGAHFSGASDVMKKYMGLALIPQAGVALGCALIAKANFPEVGGIIFTTIIATTVIYEVFGPVCTKFALEKAEEIEHKPTTDEAHT